MLEEEERSNPSRGRDASSCRCCSCCGPGSDRWRGASLGAAQLAGSARPDSCARSRIASAQSGFHRLRVNPPIVRSRNCQTLGSPHRVAERESTSASRPTFNAHPRVKDPWRCSRPSMRIWGNWGWHPNEQLEWTARSQHCQGVQMWDARMGDLAISECANQQQSGGEGGARSWGDGEE